MRYVFLLIGIYLKAIVLIDCKRAQLLHLFYNQERQDFKCLLLIVAILATRKGRDMLHELYAVHVHA